MESWIRAHKQAFALWGGIPALTVPDNTKTGVSKTCRCDPEINPTYQSFAIHYRGDKRIVTNNAIPTKAQKATLQVLETAFRLATTGGYFPAAVTLVPIPACVTPLP